MHKITRRRFLGASAVAAGAAALPPVLRAALAAPAAGNSLSSVRHVVILMQENRSFDHYFGSLQGVRGFDDNTALVLRNGDSVFNQPGASGGILPFHMDSAGTNAQCIGDLAHDWNSTHAAWNHGLADGWVAAKSALSMGYCTRADLPFHYALADAFTICDDYHCSVMGATGPNRTYLWSGMIDPNGSYEGPIIDGGDESGLTWTTYAERLQIAGVGWKVYQVADDNYNDNGLAYFSQFSNAQPGDPLYDRGMASVPSLSGDTVTDIVAAIKSDVLSASLPQVSWIVGPASASEHPDYAPAAGADFIHRILEALTADPNVWASTVLFINYDENDGYFDHALPITPAEGTPDEFIDGLPIGLGPRVPMLVISPWTRGGYVCSEVFDHTSVIRFLERWTGVAEPNISAWRRLICGDLTSAFDFSTATDNIPALPATSAPAAATARQCSTLLAPQPPTSQSMPVQEVGTRIVRPLPYQPNARSSVDPASGILRIEMTNIGTRAVHHSIYANNYRSDGPWQYDVPADKGSVKADFDVQTYGGGMYDLSLHGPNGFLRRFVGDINAAGGGLEVASAYDLSLPGCNRLMLSMINGSGSSAVFTVSSNAYRSDGPWIYRVAPGQTVSDYWNVELYTNSLYDFSATVDADSTFLRRYAGRVEAGPFDAIDAGGFELG